MMHWDRQEVGPPSRRKERPQEGLVRKVGLPQPRLVGPTGQGQVGTPAPGQGQVEDSTTPSPTVGIGAEGVGRSRYVFEC